MAEYISRESVMDALLYEQYGYLCEDAISKIPAADVAPVRRGRWEKCGWSIRCSECGYDMPFTVRNYCPNCGAKMGVDECSSE